MHFVNRPFYCFLVLLFPIALIGETKTEKSYLLVASAFAGELQAVLDGTEEEIIHKTEIHNGTEFLVGEVDGLPVVFFETGVGLVNAAMNTQLALTHYPAWGLIFSGIAGGVNPDLDKGDVVVPTRWHYHDYGGYFNPVEPGSEEYPNLVEVYGYRYDYPNFGMFIPSQVPAFREGMGSPGRVADFEVDEKLMAQAEAAAQQLELFDAYGEKATILLGGVGGSGNIFMDNAEFRRYMRSTWKSDSVDMESTAVAQVCWTNKVPFLIVRALSDLAGAQEGLNELPEYADNAWGNAGRLVGAILEELAETTKSMEAEAIKAD